MANLSFKEVVKRIAETYREDAERLNCDTCSEVFECYGYDTKELKEEILYSFIYDFSADEEFTSYDDGSIILNSGEDISYRKLIKAIRNYKFN